MRKIAKVHMLSDWSIPSLLLFFGLNACSHTTPPPENGEDTTSHAITWSIETLGEGGGNILYDVAIVNDTLAYAVGEIYLKDSSGQVDPVPYNLAVWNGKKWAPRRVTYQGGVFSTNWILAFSDQDYWVNEHVHWDGTDFQFSHIDDPIFSEVATTSAWGISSRDFYVVGRAGFIAHYNGTSWQSVESGTTLDIHDIWGATNAHTGGTEILAVASNDTDKRILLIQGTSAIPLPDSGLAGVLNSVWFVPDSRYYIVGAGISQKRSLHDARWQTFDPGVVTSYVSGGVRGTGLNDVFVAGSFSEVVHFNGVTWHNYRDQIPYSQGAVGRIAVKGDLVITVGLMGQKAVAVIGKRR